jgi:parallel beta-helix repeat protein
MKLITAFVLCLTLCLTDNLYSNYSTPGTGVSWNLADLVSNSGGVVTFSSGTYFINDTLIVTSPDTIKILTNSTVKLAFNVVFNTLGTLIINPPDSVKFTSVDTTQKFQELRLDDLSDASVIKKLIFEYSFNGLRMLDSSPLIDGCTFRYNGNGNTTTSTAINLFRCNSVIQNCRIYRNYHVGIGGGGNIANAPQILNNHIYENNISNGNVPQINLGQSGSGTLIIRGNTITGLYTNAGGIATLPLGTLNIIIENNTITNNRYGIAVQNVNTNAVIRNNIIEGNNIQGNPALGGSGINFNGNSTLIALVSKNRIRGNLWGITIQGTAKPNMGDLSVNDTNYNGLNLIYGNSNNGRWYDLFNNTPDSIKAENNYWGTANIDSVEARIFHKPDSSVLGFVDYQPIWTPTGINIISSEIPAGYYLSDAYPNPFNPITHIEFSIPQYGFVNLSVYDILGRLVETIVSENLNAGVYKIDFTASGLSSGIYFYILRSGPFSLSKKLVLVK